MTDRSIRRIEKLLEGRNIAVHRGQRVTEVGDAELVTEGGGRYAVDV